ncbi:MAG: MoaD/ThiS family protein [Verrucomicrobiae bacterium]|nr:MoaD/ThiS family protein [Verrucomicrobiae bacterium]
MPARVNIPTLLRGLTAGADSVEATGATIADILLDLENHHPGTRARILHESGAPRRSVNIFINGEDIRFLHGLQTAVHDSDEITIVPAIAGG